MIKDAPPSGQANLQVINTLQCPVTLTLENKNITIDPLDKSSEQHLSVKQNVTLMITSPADCKHQSKLSLSYQPDLKEHEWYNFVIGGVGNQLIGHMVKTLLRLPLMVEQNCAHFFFHYHRMTTHLMSCLTSIGFKRMF